MAVCSGNEIRRREVDRLLTATGRVVHLVRDRRALRKTREMYYDWAEARNEILRDVPVQMMGGWVRRLQRRLGVRIRRLDPWHQRSILRACLREVVPPESSHLREIWNRRGMVASLYEFASATRGYGLTSGDLGDGTPEEIRWVMQTYEERLRCENAADKPLLFSHIIEALQDDDSLRFERILVDGFCDMPPSEHRLLIAAAERADSVRVLVPGDGRVSDVYPTDAQLRCQWGSLSKSITRYLPDRLADSPLSGRLFRIDPTDLTPEPSERPRIRLWAVSDEHEQNDRIAAFVKEKLKGDRGPGDCCVIVRNERHRAALARHFLRSGIPVSTSGDVSLAETRVGRLVNALLEVIESPTVEGVFRLVSSPYVGSEWRELRRLCAYLPEDMDDVSMHRELQTVLDSLQYQQRSDSFRLESLDRLTDAIAEIRRLDGRLELLLDHLHEPDTSDPAACAENLMEVMSVLGAEETLRGLMLGDGGRTPEVIADLSAWRAFRDQMDRGIDPSLLPRPSRTAIGWSDYAELIREFLQHETVPIPDVPDRTGLRPRAGRGVMLSSGEPPEPGEYPVVVLPYMVSGVFPGRTSPGWLEDACFGDDLHDPEAEERAENYFFYRCACAANDDLVLVFPQEVDEAPQAPSAYLQEVEMAASARLVDFTAGENPGQLSGLGRISCWRDFRIRMLAAGEHSGDAGSLIRESMLADEMDPQAVELSLLACRKRHCRFWSEWDGNISENDVEDLRSRFPENHTISPTYLNRYARCPFRFFAGEVLGLSPQFQTEREIPIFLVGRIYHAVLEAYYGRYAQDIANGEGPTPEEERREIRRLVAEWSRRCRRSMGWIHEHFFDSLERRAEEVLSRFLTWERERREASAGTGGELLPWQVEEPFSLELSGASSCGGEIFLTINGIIDRVDRSEFLATEDPDEILVFDYKMTSQPPGREDMIEGRDLQVPIYIKAAREMLDDLRVLGGGYLSINGRTARSGLYLYEAASGLQLNPEKYSVSEEEMSAALDTCRRTILRYWEQIRSGFFPVWPDDDKYCGWCEFSGACRYEPRRIKRKTAEKGVRDDG